MSSDENVCVICGKAGVTKWTIHGGGAAAIANLCADHSKPLNDAVVAAGTKPPKVVKPWEKASELPRRTTRKPKIEVLDWTPPEER